MADLVQAISAYTKEDDWEAIKSLAMNPEAAVERHYQLSLLPKTGGLRSWTFRDGDEVPAIWLERAPYRNLEICEKVIIMSWTVTTDYGIGNIDVFYPVVTHEGHYYIRFHKLK